MESVRKALIIYGSELGNTEAAAGLIAGVLERAGLDVVVKNVREAEVTELLGDQDVTLLGCSTWGATEADVQADFEPFFEAMDAVSLAGRKLAVFGCGDKGWDVFCRAVIAIEAKTGKLGARLVADSLKIDGHPGTVREEVEAWAAGVAAAV
jgi:flavodoxin short chain